MGAGAALAPLVVAEEMEIRVETEVAEEPEIRAEMDVVLAAREAIAIHALVSITSSDQLVEPLH